MTAFTLAALLILPPPMVPTFRGSPSVIFDFPHAIEFTDITTPEFRQRYPDEKLVRGTFRVSVQRRSTEVAIRTLYIRIIGRSPHMSVNSFAPKTTLQSDVVGEVDIKETRERIRSGGISLGAALPFPSGSVTFHGSPAADVNQTKKNLRTESKRVRPRLTAIINSGTVEQGHGVFYRLHRTGEGALEDVHRFTVTFRVPKQWRGGYAAIDVAAETDRGFFRSSRPTSQGNVLQGIFLSADLEARDLARKLADAQARLLLHQKSRSAWDIRWESARSEVESRFRKLDIHLPSWLKESETIRELRDSVYRNRAALNAFGGSAEGKAFTFEQVDVGRSEGN